MERPRQWLTASFKWSAGFQPQVLMRVIRRFVWTCGSRPPTPIWHREATTLTKTGAWDRILSVLEEKVRLISWTRLIEAAMPVVSVLERKGVKSHGEGEGIYCDD